jgi:hypothetical protein
MSLKLLIRVGVRAHDAFLATLESKMFLVISVMNVSEIALVNFSS